MNEERQSKRMRMKGGRYENPENSERAIRKGGGGLARSLAMTDLTAEGRIIAPPPPPHLVPHHLSLKDTPAAHHAFPSPSLYFSPSTCQFRARLRDPRGPSGRRALPSNLGRVGLESPSPPSLSPGRASVSLPPSFIHPDHRE